MISRAGASEAALRMARHARELPGQAWTKGNAKARETRDQVWIAVTNPTETAKKMAHGARHPVKTLKEHPMIGAPVFGTIKAQVFGHGGHIPLMGNLMKTLHIPLPHSPEMWAIWTAALTAETASHILIFEGGAKAVRRLGRTKAARKVGAWGAAGGQQIARGARWMGETPPVKAVRDSPVGQATSTAVETTAMVWGASRQFAHETKETVSEKNSSTIKAAREAPSKVLSRLRRQDGQQPGPGAVEVDKTNPPGSET